MLRGPLSWLPIGQRDTSVRAALWLGYRSAAAGQHYSFFELRQSPHRLAKFSCVYSSGIARQRRLWSRCWRWTHTVQKHPVNSWTAGFYSSWWGTLLQTVNLVPCFNINISLFTDLFVCILQEMGFEEQQSKMLLEKFATVQAVLTSAEAKSKFHLQYRDCPDRGSTGAETCWCDWHAAWRHY